ncbi:MAEL [Bugula neritina]|uniref:MAEL n=1 Tax=Bugula neritina TaxID=10212 RepID=A0A7J7JDQ7_BUGNE|nr:MAEL [Bugula neritina]
MPGKNKQQKNAFYFYMQELMQDLKREGRVFPGGLADVVPIAHPRFKALDDKEKERFENMAKEFKKRMRGQPGDAIRQDNVGNIIAHRRDDVMEYEKDREKEIKSFVRKWPQDLSWVAEKKFILLMFKLYAKPLMMIFCQLKLL